MPHPFGDRTHAMFSASRMVSASIRGPPFFVLLSSLSLLILAASTSGILRAETKIVSELRTLTREAGTSSPFAASALSDQAGQHLALL